MTRIALLRHYPTIWNRERRLQGQSDIPLTSDAEETLAGLVMPPPWDSARIVASSLVRARRTAEILAGSRSVTTDQRLIEIGFGDWEGRLAAELEDDPGSGFRPTHLWAEDDGAPGGETMRAVWERVRPALADLAGGPDTVLVIHKALMRVILRRAGIEPEIKRGRLYPLELHGDGVVGAPGAVVRLVPR